MQNIFMLGILGAVLPPPSPTPGLFDEEHPHDHERLTGTESE